MTATTTTYTMSPETVAYEAKALRTWVRKADRWEAECAAHQAAMQPALARLLADGMEIGLAYQTAARLPEVAATTPSLRRMPSKDSKHRAYGRADHLVRGLGLQVERGSDRAYLKAVLAAAGYPA